jgi:hypothetical protein
MFRLNLSFIIIVTGLLFTISSFGQAKSSNQREEFYLPEYHCDFEPDSCSGEIIMIIRDMRYVRIKLLNNCNEMEVRCFNRKDSSLIECGRYRNVNNIITQKALARDVSFNKSRIVEIKSNQLQRIGQWNIYSKSGELIKTEQY